jgi:hypothetical protein
MDNPMELFATDCDWLAFLLEILFATPNDATLL